jgi:hypothetical protein
MEKVLKFRKKPVVIEAVKVTAADWNGESFDGSPFSEIPKWLYEAFHNGTLSVLNEGGTDYARWVIKTLEDGPNGEAKHIADPGDWIIRGIQGELYPCKPDIFELTYEAAE